MCYTERLCTIAFGLCIVMPGIEANTRLMRHLKSIEYSPHLRPVKSEDTITKVFISMTLYQIRELHEKEQYLQINAWIHLHWYDELLTWDPRDFNGSTRILMPYDMLWRPDIMLYNSVDEERTNTKVLPDTNLLLFYNGYVTWFAPALLKSACLINVKMYPFDTQRCNLTFGSWMYKSNQMNLTNLTRYADTNDYLDNGEWVLKSVECFWRELIYSCCRHSVTEVVFSLTITRRPLFYLFHLLFPCVLLLLIGILVFCLPPESGEKVGLAITLLLAMTVFMLVVMDYIPPTSEVVSVFDKFFAAAILMLAVGTGFAVLVTNLHYRGAHHARPPLWLSALFLHYLPKFVFMNKVTWKGKYSHIVDEAKRVSENRAIISGTSTNRSDIDQERFAALAKLAMLRGVKISTEGSMISADRQSSPASSKTAAKTYTKITVSSTVVANTLSEQKRSMRGPHIFEQHGNVTEDEAGDEDVSRQSINPSDDGSGDKHDDKLNVSNSAIPPKNSDTKIPNSALTSKYWEVIRDKVQKLPQKDYLTRELLEELANEELARIAKQRVPSASTNADVRPKEGTLKSPGRSNEASSYTSSYYDNEDVVDALNDILDEMNELQESHKTHASLMADSPAEVEWRLIAMVVDRFCFLLFTILTVSLTAFIFYPAM